ncbi:sialidase family protein [Brachybacterium sp. p3-SID957]|uniref:exo-alpha-sialidase n=1 Tax=Brachybacterium sp. p3-SID957 TaxID=2916049 RepID=UPI00223AA3D1|nr:sialidase family protein [Brachybacterium sp. p3-SID957]MCT1776279.1 glycoside hydrolase [Brachybacterium sp. p3-SID957]
MTSNAADSLARLHAPAVTVFDAELLGCAAVRIPALLRCRNGRLVAFAEARHHSPGDTGRIDVIASTSQDGFQWSPARTIATNGDGTHGNPVPIEASTGEIVLLTTTNGAHAKEGDILVGAVDRADGRRVHVTRLSSDLSQVGDAREITETVFDPTWAWYATGPGHGVRLASGRLVVAANHSYRRPAVPDGARDDDTQPSTAWFYGAHGLISDDDGHSWRLAWVTEGTDGIHGPNESALTVDPDRPEEVVVTIRNQHEGDAAARSAARTQHHATSLRSHQVLTGYDGPRVQCGVGADRGTGSILLTSPAAAGRRADLVLRVITDATSDTLGLLRAGPAGYSDMAVGEDVLDILVETGEASTHERIDLLRMDLMEMRRAVWARTPSSVGQTARGD